MGSRAIADLRARGHHVVDLTGTDADTARARATRALDDGLGALVVVGGDGMAHLGAGLVAETAVPLGVIPVGTGNDVARGLGLPIGDVGAALDVVHSRLAARRSRAVDAVTVEGGQQQPVWFVGVLGAGFDAVVNERANSWPWVPGRARYDLAIARELPVFRPLPYTIALDGERVDVDAMLVAVANAPSYGGGMRVCPDAVMDDGLLDVLVLEPVSRREFVRLFPTVYSGAHVWHPRVTIRRARTVELALRDPRRVLVAYADGERLGPLPRTCRVVPGALRVLA